MFKPWIGTSWKMNKTLSEALDFAQVLANFDTACGIAATADAEHANGTYVDTIQPFLIPPFTSIREVKKILCETTVKVGAQNMHWAENGAWTGEISAPMLTDCGAEIVELGHSERREYFGENNEAVGRKTESAVRHGLIPLICIGETLDERESGKARNILEFQVLSALAELNIQQKSSEILFAYEPVWAIGENGIPATAEYADARQADISAIASDLLGHPVPCLYGGSVNLDNCQELIQCPHIDGLFIGRAAWDVKGYLKILNKCNNTLSKKE